MKSIAKLKPEKSLEKENAMLYDEVIVARKASAITARLVTRQFEKMEEILQQLEKSAAASKAGEKEISDIFQMVQAVNSTLDFDTVAHSVIDALKKHFSIRYHGDSFD
jgi:phage regulator Rha-like protein